MASRGSRFAGARFRGLFLIAMVAVPLLVVTTYSYGRERSEAREDAQSRAINIATLAQHEYEVRVRAAQQFISPDFPFGDSGATIAEIARNPERCNRALADLLKRTPGYLNLFEVDLTGHLICSGTPLTAPVYVADRDYYIETTRTLKPAIGDLTMGRVSARPAVIVSHPIFDRTNTLVGLVAASLDLSDIVILPAALELPPGSSVTMIDRAGTVMARNIEPEKWIGQPGPELLGLPKAVITGENRTAIGTGPDGVQRLYGIVPLRPQANAPIQGKLLVGIPTQTAYGAADAALRQNLFWLALVCALAMAGAWIGSERLVIDPLRRMSSSMQRIASGQFETRTGLEHEGGEIGMLAQAVDQMAEQLQRTQAEIRIDRQEMASILSNTPSVMAIVQTDGTVTRINRAIERRFGWPEAEFVQRNLNLVFDEPIFPIHPEQGPRLAERRGVRQDGSTFPVEVDLREVAGSGGQRYLAIVRDLTDRRRAEAEREMGRIALARAEFLRTLSHELRSPLTAVLGFAQLIRQDADSPRMQRQAGDIEDAGRYMLALVNDLLDLARIDAGRWEVNLTEVDVTELLTTVTEGLRPRAAARHLGLAVSTTPPVAIARTDARILREIATNLIENAVKYTETGAISAQASVDEETLQLEVIDTGIGIPSDRLDSIFNEFEQVRPVGVEQGTGLGLAITRKLVTLLGGTVQVASTPGAGSVFTVRVPSNLPPTTPPTPPPPADIATVR